MEENCHVERFEKEVDPKDLESAQVAYLAVEGLGCPRCALRVENGLNRLDGVFEATVSLEQRVAEVYYSPKQVKVEDLVSAVAGSGDGGHHRYSAQVLKA